MATWIPLEDAAARAQIDHRALAKVLTRGRIRTVARCYDRPFEPPDRVEALLAAAWWVEGLEGGFLRVHIRGTRVGILLCDVRLDEADLVAELARVGLTLAPAPPAAAPQAPDAIPYQTGLPGRPSSWSLAEAECRRRWKANERHPGRAGLESPAEWARVLRAWLQSAHPGAALPEPKTLTNKLGALLRELAKDAPPPPP
jgi:hypothetical protein